MSADSQTAGQLTVAVGPTIEASPVEAAPKADPLPRQDAEKPVEVEVITSPAEETPGQVTLRPPYVRQDSGQTIATIVDPDVQGDKDKEKGDVIVSDSKAADSQIPSPTSYPPALPSEDSSPPLEETKALRRLRMASAFCTLFLAGWKCVSETLRRTRTDLFPLLVAGLSGH